MKKTPPEITPSSPDSLPTGLVADIDTTYLTQQRDMFASGLMAQIGPHALAVWLAIKSHADFATGEAWPGVRRLMEQTGLASATVQKAIKRLHEARMLREARRMGQIVVYVARERMDVRIGPRVICTIVVDYVPLAMRERLAKLKAAAAGDFKAADVWTEVELLPGPGMVYDPQRGTFVAMLLADEVPQQALSSTATPMFPAVEAARERIKATAKALRRVPKK